LRRYFEIIPNPILGGGDQTMPVFEEILGTFKEVQWECVLNVEKACDDVILVEVHVNKMW
jgi:hypothetical protein